MLMEWLEPAIEKNINETIKLCEANEEIETLNRKCDDILDNLKLHLDQSLVPDLLKLEGFFNEKSSLLVEITYRKTMAETLELGRSIWNK